MGCARNQVSQVRPCVLMGCYTIFKCVRTKYQKRTRADHASIGANQRCLNELPSREGGVGGRTNESRWCGFQTS
jgi:hypothetical protein